MTVIVLAWLVLWELADRIIDNRIVLSGPTHIIGTLIEQMQQPDFWVICGASFARITVGFLLSFAAGFLLALLCFRFTLLRDIITPVMVTLKIVPMISFVIMLLIWVGNQALTISNPAFPPIAPMKQKGYLVVAEEGSMTLTMDGFNAIFAQLNIGSSKEVTVKDLRWAEATCPGGKRIDGITLDIGNNYNGYYSFADCKQYATPFEIGVNMQLDLIIDFSTAVAAYVRPGENDDAYTKTFTDETTGISVQVDTTEEWGENLAGASMDIHYLKEGDAGYEDVKFQADRLYKNNGDSLKMLALDLKDKDGKTIATMQALWHGPWRTASQAARLQLHSALLMVAPVPRSSRSSIVPIRARKGNTDKSERTSGSPAGSSGICKEKGIIFCAAGIKEESVRPRK